MLLDRILKEEISLLDGEQQRKVSKAEAITRRLVIGALKGDSRSQEAENLPIIAEFVEAETGKDADALDRRPQQPRWQPPAWADAPSWSLSSTACRAMSPLWPA
jgi:hypothetical protein